MTGKQYFKKYSSTYIVNRKALLCEKEKEKQMKGKIALESKLILKNSRSLKFPTQANLIKKEIVFLTEKGTLILSGLDCTQLLPYGTPQELLSEKNNLSGN